jgi:hypothetical protein
MDERIADLLDSYPQIFESKVPRTGDLEDEFVVISNTTDLNLGLDDPFSGSEYWESDVQDRDLLRLLDNIAYRGPWSWLKENSGGPHGLAKNIRRRIKGNFPGSPGGRPSPLSNFAPPPDALAFYLPFHRYPEYWGIYLLDVGVQSFSLAIGASLLSRGISTLNAAALRNIAIVYLYHHEAYHSAVEGFAIRAELPMRRPFYRTGLRRLYQRQWTPGTPHEETLATAYGLRKVRDNIKLPSAVLTATLAVLAEYLQQCAPEYAAGVAYVDDSKFALLEQQFKEHATNANVASRIVVAPEAWRIGTFLMAPLVQRNRKYSWICDRNDFRQRASLAIHYFRRTDVIRCLAKIAATQQISGGRHMHLVREIDEDGTIRNRRTQIPSGEIKAGTLNKMLKDLELPMSSHEFRDQCRKAGESLS